MFITCQMGENSKNSVKTRYATNFGVLSIFVSERIKVETIDKRILKLKLSAKVMFINTNFLAKFQLI